MKLKQLILSALLVAGASTAFSANFSPAPGNDEWPSQCYGLAMVGMDSVINSRLNILPEHVLHLALSEPGPAVTEGPRTDVYSTRLLKIIFDAYLWQGEPGDYAAQVMQSCSA